MEEKKGWIKLYRKVLEDPAIKDNDYLALWIYLLLNASHQPHESVFGGQIIMLQPGQLVTGRKSIASNIRVTESKTYRMLTWLENEHLIEQRKSNQNTLVTIVNWHKYQDNEQQNEQQMNNKRTTDEQRMNTYKNDKNEKNVRNIEAFSPPSLDSVKDFIDSLNYEMDPEEFFDYYEERNWIRNNGTPVKDWKACARAWERREKKWRMENGKEHDRPSYMKPFPKEERVAAETMPDEMREKWMRGKKASDV